LNNQNRLGRLAHKQILSFHQAQARYDALTPDEQETPDFDDVCEMDCKQCEYSDRCVLAGMYDKED
jgi:hypothetical protein